MQPNVTMRSGGKRSRPNAFHSAEDVPAITIITAAWNAASTIEATIQSVANQTYPHIEYIVVDGGSTDGTLDIIQKYDDVIDYWISEPDRGVYDAMNKGISASRGTWLNFLNANDRLAAKTTIEDVANGHFSGEPGFIYSDVILADRGQTQLYVCDHTRKIVNHQASIYKKELHAQHGSYLVAPGLTISDYLFFSLVPEKEFVKADRAIAIYDTSGMSQSSRARDQKFSVDFLLNGMSKRRFILYLLFHDYYHRLRRRLPRKTIA